MDMLHHLVASLSSRRCADSLVNHLNVTDTACLSLLVSKCLGFGIVVAASVVKVPQLVKIVNQKSAEGLNLSSVVLETAAYAISLAYNHRHGNPFSTYGEILFILVQDVVLVLLINFYRRQSGYSGLLALLFAAAQYYLFKTASPDALQTLQAMTIPLTLSSRIPQIVEIYKRGNTGNLSAITIFLFFLGALARVFTTIKEVPDKLLVLGAGLGALLNGILTIQMLWYWNRSSKKAKKA